MAEYCRVVHPFPPIYNEQSKILILGSLPSVVSREQEFYYMHPRNTFWKVITQLCGEMTIPQTKEGKIELLLKHQIAVWDVIYSCEIKGSDDSSIMNCVTTDIPRLLEYTGIKMIFANGKKAGQLYHQYVYPNTQIEIQVLPSTSPANAAMNYETKYQKWSVVKKYL